MIALRLLLELSNDKSAASEKAPAGPPEGLLTNGEVCLRGVEADDLDFLYRWENNPAVWRYGDCGASVESTERFSRAELSKFIENQQYDIYITGQIRFVICLRNRERTPQSDLDGNLTALPPHPMPQGNRDTGMPIGFIDLFDFDPVARSAGIGILICDAADRGKGYGARALQLAVDYARRFLGLATLWCNIDPANAASAALFSAAGFKRT
jgi:diamine N-acetyltransferase